MSTGTGAKFVGRGWPRVWPSPFSSGSLDRAREVEILMGQYLRLQVDRTGPPGVVQRRRSEPLQSGISLPQPRPVREIEPGRTERAARPNVALAIDGRGHFRRPLDGF